MQKIIISLLCIASCIHAMEQKSISIIPFAGLGHKEFVLRTLHREKDHLVLAGQSIKDAENAILSDSNYKTHVLMLEQEPIGFVTFSVRQQSVCGIKIGKPEGRIDMLAIDWSRRRKGHGTLLLLHAIEELESKEVDSIGLYVNRNNPNAIQLYEKKQFTHQPMLPQFFFHFYRREITPPEND